MKTIVLSIVGFLGSLLPVDFAIAQNAESLLKSFYYITHTENAEEQELWINTVKSKFYNQQEPVIKTLELRALQKNRDKLWEDYSFFWMQNRCSDFAVADPKQNVESKIRILCQKLSKQGLFLMNSAFLKESPFDLKEAEDLIAESKCEEAVTKINGVRTSEGNWIPMLNILEQAYSCLGNNARLLELQELKDSIRKLSYGK